MQITIHHGDEPSHISWKEMSTIENRYINERIREHKK